MWALKMINIQKSYSLCIGYIRSYSVCFGSIQSTLVIFGPHWPYSVHFIPIRSILFTLVHFSSIRSILFILVLFGPHWLYSVHFDPIQSNLVIFSPICSYLVHYVHFDLICPFGLIRSISILYGPISIIRSILPTLVLFGPL